MSVKTVLKDIFRSIVPGAGSVIRLEDALSTLTAENVLVTIPFKMELEMIRRHDAYRGDDEGLYKMVRATVGASLRKETAGKDLAALQQAPDDICAKAVQDAVSVVETMFLLKLKKIELGKIEVPPEVAALQELFAVGQKASRSVMQGLPEGIAVNRPLTLVKPKSQA